MSFNPLGLVRQLLFGLSDRQVRRKIGGFRISRPEQLQLIDQILDAFRSGYNSALAVSHLNLLPEIAATVTPFYRPFFVEGVAMGVGPRTALFSHPADVLESLSRVLFPQYEALVCVGWGWWLAARYHRRSVLPPNVLDGLDPILRGVAIDGMGFASGFLRFRQVVGSMPPPFEDPDCATLWTQGFGRSLWFVYHDRLDLVRQEIDAAPAQLRPEFWSGMGLANAFAGFSSLKGLPTPPSQVRGKDDFEAWAQGTSFALVGRQRGNPDLMEAWLKSQTPHTENNVRRMLALCEPTEHDRSSNLPLGGAYLDWQRRIRPQLGELYRSSQYLPNVASLS